MLFTNIANGCLDVTREALHAVLRSRRNILERAMVALKHYGKMRSSGLGRCSRFGL